jgi:hypothetical protein
MIEKSLAHPEGIPPRNEATEHVAEDLEHVGRVAARTLDALEERFRNELMDEVERLELRERIVRMKRKAAQS